MLGVSVTSVQLLAEKSYSLTIHGDLMLELTANAPASNSLFSCPINPQTDFLSSISSKDGEEKAYQNHSSK